MKPNGDKILKKNTAEENKEKEIHDKTIEKMIKDQLADIRRRIESGSTSGDSSGQSKLSSSSSSGVFTTAKATAYRQATGLPLFSDLCMLAALLGVGRY
jgi:hypothetical protein